MYLLCPRLRAKEHVVLQLESLCDQWAEFEVLALPDGAVELDLERREARIVAVDWRDRCRDEEGNSEVVMNRRLRATKLRPVNMCAADQLDAILVLRHKIQKLAGVVLVPELLNPVEVVESREDVHAQDELPWILRCRVVLHQRVEPDELLLALLEHAVIFLVIVHGVQRNERQR